MHPDHVTTASRRVQATATAVLVVVGLGVTGCGSETTEKRHAARAVGAARELVPTFSHPGRIDNRYLPITAWKTCVMRGRTVDGEKEKSVRTVLKRRKTFTIGDQQVGTVVVRDDAYEDSELVESTLDYFAQADDGTVYYVGEQVKNLSDGRVVNTEGTWLYGVDTDRLGVAMPPEPQLGQQWHFEDVPGVTTESNRVEETGLRTKIRRWGVRTDVIRVQEFIQPEGEVENKLYASGIGLVAEYAPDARSRFVRCTT
jgi:hypothetical protein